jgi:hypothetical protein
MQGEQHAELLDGGTGDNRRDRREYQRRGRRRNVHEGRGEWGLPKACALFTSDIAAAALGGPVNPPKATQPNPKETICKYVRTDGSAFGTASVGLWIIIQIPGKSTKIKGLGDQAQAEDPFGVSVRKGSNGFNVSLAVAGDDFSGQAATDQSAANVAAATTAAKQLVVTFGKKSKG